PVGVIDVGYRTQPADAYVGYGWSVLGAKIRNGKGQVTEAKAELPGIRVRRLGIEGRADGRKRGALKPRGGSAAVAEGSFEVHGGHRVVGIKPNVVFTGPHHLHGPARLLRQHGGFHGEIGKRLSPEGTAEQRDVNRNVFFLQSHGGGDGIASSLGIL